jgi:hypothetical protein
MTGAVPPRRSTPQISPGKILSSPPTGGNLPNPHKKNQIFLSPTWRFSFTHFSKIEMWGNSKRPPDTSPRARASNPTPTSKKTAQFRRIETAINPQINNL